MYILGVSCYYHDAAACLVADGDVVAAAAEERFSRDKHDNSFPSNAIHYCLDEAGIEIDMVDKVVFYEKPVQKFFRFMETAARTFPRGYRLFSRVLPEWLGTKLRFQRMMQKEGYNGVIEYTNHHLSHAAAAYHPSPFDDAAILTMDGIGEWASNAMFEAERDTIEPLRRITFPDSIGLLYSTITAYLGFMVNNDEYKVMGLAAYGDPDRYRDAFDQLIAINDDGSYQLNMDYFAYAYKHEMYTDSLIDLLGPARERNGELTQRHKDIAATLQDVLETVVKRQVDELYRLTDTENLCMAGGVALNSACNGMIRNEMPFDNIWIQPAAGDDGGAMGVALEHSPDRSYTMQDVYLGPSHDSETVSTVLDKKEASYERMDRSDRINHLVSQLVQGNVVGLFQGRLEWGPRALGNRSILADPRDESMIDTVNTKVKFREAFRPFAPTVLADHAADIFSIDGESPYMLFVTDVKDEWNERIPAVTHVDGTSRIQTLQRSTNPFYYDLIEQFYDETGVPVLLNTSFNLKGMPIVNTPGEAYSCFTQSGIDTVCIEDVVVRN